MANQVLICAAEINHLQRKSDSQSRDLKKLMTDNAATIAEFEKALVRKSEECNVSVCSVCCNVDISPLTIVIHAGAVLQDQRA